MQYTISIKLETTHEQYGALEQLQEEFNKTCNRIVPIARENRCWNSYALHHLSYYQTQPNTLLGSQMLCNTIKAVCNAYKVLQVKSSAPVPVITFKPKSSVHFDKKTYTLQKDGNISLYTMDGRISVKMVLGDFQKGYLQRGKAKEAELVNKNGQWFFNLVLDLPDAQQRSATGKVLGVDLGENNLVATSSGMLLGGGELRHKCDCALAKRKQLQSNGSKSSTQLLKKISGREARHIMYTNHVISKKIVAEAKAKNCDTIAMEDLTNIRSRIKCGKRVRSRLHRWSWAQLQRFIEYKAKAAGLRVVYVNPAYTSQMCSTCGNIGIRQKHRLKCKVCGVQRHSDLNASLNIRRIAVSADAATGTVNCPNVATKKKDKRL